MGTSRQRRRAASAWPTPSSGQVATTDMAMMARRPDAITQQLAHIERKLENMVARVGRLDGGGSGPEKPPTPLPDVPAMPRVMWADISIDDEDDDETQKEAHARRSERDELGASVPLPDRGLAVGTIIKPKLGLQPEPFGEACYGFWQGGELIKNDEPQGNQVFCQMSDCIPEVVKAMVACVQKAGQQKLSSTNITADDPNEMIARAKYCLSVFGPMAENCALLVDGYVAGGTDVTVARRNFPRQFLHYHRAGHGAVMSPQTQCGCTAFVHTKISRVIGASSIVLPAEILKEEMVHSPKHRHAQFLGVPVQMMQEEMVHFPQYIKQKLVLQRTATHIEGVPSRMQENAIPVSTDTQHNSCEQVVDGPVQSFIDAPGQVKREGTAQDPNDTQQECVFQRTTAQIAEVYCFCCIVDLPQTMRVELVHDDPKTDTKIITDMLHGPKAKKWLCNKNAKMSRRLFFELLYEAHARACARTEETGKSEDLDFVDALGNVAGEVLKDRAKLMPYIGVLEKLKEKLQAAG